MTQLVLLEFGRDFSWPNLWVATFYGLDSVFYEESSWRGFTPFINSILYPWNLRPGRLYSLSDYLLLLLGWNRGLNMKFGGRYYFLWHFLRWMTVQARLRLIIGRLSNPIRALRHGFYLGLMVEGLEYFVVSPCIKTWKVSITHCLVRCRLLRWNKFLYVGARDL
jgi:hypothetical protein